MKSKKTMVLGASENPDRASYQAILKLAANGHEILAIGNKEGQIGNSNILRGKPIMGSIDTITLYINSERQKNFYSYILSLHPRRLLFNPGTENDELAVIAKAHGIQTEESCTLVLLGTGQY